MFLVAHRFGRFKFRIFVVVFYGQGQLKISKQIFEIPHDQIDELPRTLVQLKKIFQFPFS